MTVNQIKKIIEEGEGIHNEFKEAYFNLPRDTFESICSFLNRNGGHLLLGIKNDGTIEGVLEDSIEQIINTLITSCNNPQKLFPTFYLTTEVIEIERRKIVYVYIPESSQVHNTAGEIFDRNSDGDFNISNNPSLVSQLYLRKQNTFSENNIYQYLTISDFDEILFQKVRSLVKNQRSNHPWSELNNEGIMKSASLWRRDLQNGTEGYTLAAAVLLGKEEVIQSILPHYKTDAILRIENTERYDDRDDIRCNLISAYSRLTEFIKKHFPDKFHLEGAQRVSLRDKLFREIIANLLVHREFTNQFPAKLIIDKTGVHTENANRAHGSGHIDLRNFSPFPKNPIISKFFKEIGFVEELGSGVRNTAKYLKLYGSNKEPEFIEGDIFKTIIPLKIAALEKSFTIPLKAEIRIIEPIAEALGIILNEGVNEGVNENKISELIRKELTKVIRELMKNPGQKALDISKNIKKSKKTVERYIRILRSYKIVEFKGVFKTGGYYLTEKFNNELEKIK